MIEGFHKTVGPGRAVTVVRDPPSEPCKATAYFANAAVRSGDETRRRLLAARRSGYQEL